jgi:hypothetical protein
MECEQEIGHKRHKRHKKEAGNLHKKSRFREIVVQREADIVARDDDVGRS